MNEEQRNRSAQFAGDFTEKEFLRYGCALISFLLIGLALGIAFHNVGITIILIALSHGIMWLAPYWQPAYTIVHKIMGNPNIPSALPAHPKKWWHYIPIAIKVLMLLIVLRLGLQLLFQ